MQQWLPECVGEDERKDVHLVDQAGRHEGRARRLDVGLVGVPQLTHDLAHDEFEYEAERARGDR